MTKTLITQFRAARTACTPIVCVQTADPAATIKAIRELFNGDGTPFIQWDIVRGIGGLGEAGAKAVKDLRMPEGIMPDQLIDPVTALQVLMGIQGSEPDESGRMRMNGAITFFLNAHRVISQLGVSQAVWNLRDYYKSSGRMLVLVCPAMDLPTEIQQDVRVIDEPLPDEKQLGIIVRLIYKSAKLEAPDDLGDAVEAISGLAAFPAEQACAESISKAGLAIDDLWDRKRSMIEATKGLTVWRGGETFADMRGSDNAIQYFERMMAGQDPPRCVVWIDEIEKQLAGAGTDTSGVSTEMVGALLTWMGERKNIQAVLLIGPAGSGKSMLAKCTGGSHKKPTIAFDLGAMKSSLVGESGLALRQTFKVIDAVSQGYVLVIATCNSFGTLSPEMKRRFKSATFFCDLPTDEEKKAIWKLYISKYGLKSAQAKIPSDKDWTGAEIQTCCQTAYRFRISLIEASAYIVPVAKSSPDVIQRLREQADGKFISASYAGTYERKRQEEQHGARLLEVNG